MTDFWGVKKENMHNFLQIPKRLKLMDTIVRISKFLVEEILVCGVSLSTSKAAASFLDFCLLCWGLQMM